MAMLAPIRLPGWHPNVAGVKYPVASHRKPVFIREEVGVGLASGFN